MTTAARIFYPRALVRFTALIQLSRTHEEVTSVTDVAIPRSVTIERNDYNTADKVTLEIDSKSFPFLPRLIRQVLIQVYAGDAGDMSRQPEDLQDDDSLIRFIGYVDDPESSYSEEDGVVRWTARDYTALLLGFKRPPVAIVPSYGDNLETALRRIVSALPSGERIGLELVGADTWPNLAIGAPPGLTNAKIPVKPEDTAWHLVKRACDPVALIPRIVLDKLVVSTSRGLISPARRPVFVLGSTISDFKEKRNTERIREGIGLSAYDPVQRKQITALFPPENDALVAKHRKHATKKHATPPHTPGTEDHRAWFPYPSVPGGQEALNDAAERLFNERARQEFEGEFTSTLMRVEGDPPESPDGEDASFDVTGLENGDRVFIVIDPGYRQLLTGLDTTDERIQFLVDVGYSERLAPTIVRAFEEAADGPLEVYVRKAVHKYGEENGYDLQVSFNNLLSVSNS